MKTLRPLPPVERVRPGLWSVPVPIPDSPLRYTLSYLYTDDAGVVVVDPGWDSDSGRAALTDGLAAAGAAVTDVMGVVVTHVHPDHHGQSGWLRETAGAWVAMHPAERDTLPGRVWTGADAAVPGDRRWLRAHGVPEAELAALTVDPARVGPLLAMAEPDRLVEDGDRLPIPGHEVHAVWTPGHTPGHLCLHDAGAGALLTGDHLLPRISPNVGAHGIGDADPLSRYLDSLRRVAGFADCEALPAHEYRFSDPAARAHALIAHHRERCAEVMAAVTGDATAWAIAAQLTWSKGWAALGDMGRRMALSETLAHLRHLETAGELTREGGSPERWRRSPAGETLSAYLNRT